MTANAKPLPSQELLMRVLDYDPATGFLTWKARDESIYPEKTNQTAATLGYFNKYHAGCRADLRRDQYGYPTITLFGEGYRAHRIIWKLMMGVDPVVIDHINRIRDDNRFENLRDTTTLGNAWNRSAANVWQVDKSGLWRGEITFHGRVIRISSFERREDAEKAVAAVRDALFQLPPSPALGAHNFQTISHEDAFND